MVSIPTRTGALNIVSGQISNGATWSEDVDMTSDGAVISGADTWTWRFTFRCNEDSASPDLILSTADGTLAIVQGSTSTTLQIRVSVSNLSKMDGDYVADLASKDGSGNVIHWAHGIVTFIQEPVWS